MIFFGKSLFTLKKILEANSFRNRSFIIFFVCLSIKLHMNLSPFLFPIQKLEFSKANLRPILNQITLNYITFKERLYTLREVIFFW